ncbi:MAG: aldehyde ferredoxin oxidoreductase family protein [Deltaproteobacteria bacterium]|nr:MAG: aldehyde ferredoxin oxidoreductase family protein [Deltaproteobacteria bacterium]
MAFLGQILDIDLNTGVWNFFPFSEKQARKFLGGRGLNVKLLYENLPPGIDPLGPDNILIFSCGLLTGTAAPSSARLHINALSPLTGLLGSSNVGGSAGAKLRSCGIQQLIIRGKASKPVYLWISSDSIEIRNAESFWGLDTWQTQERIKSNLASDKLKILTIGPGGENGTLFGCIMTDRDHAAGRTGMGTVMGSKNLKAIVIKGQRQKRPFRSKSKGHEAIKQYVLQMKHSPHYEGIVKHGGAGYVKWADDLGILSTFNYRQNHFEAAALIDGKNLEKNITRSHGCYHCPIHCKADLEFRNNDAEPQQAVRPEFESMLALGAKCGLRDLHALVMLDNLCSRLGLDTISAGNAIAFAMDLYERGILTTADTGGLDLTWGNAEAMEKIILQMVYGNGIGGILSQGVRRAAKSIGRGAEKYAPHVKGLEMAGYHPYNILGTALGYSVSSRGADFADIYATMEYKWLPEEASKVFGTPQAVDLYSIHGKAQLVRRAMIVGIVLDSLGLCKVPALCLICSFDLVGEADVTAALTGWSVNVSELFTFGEKIANLERLFNLRHGASGADDRLPSMFFEKDYNSGKEPSKPHEWMEPMIKEFYRVMGWDERGVPTPEKLAELGISPVDFPIQTAA